MRGGYLVLREHLRLGAPKAFQPLDLRSEDRGESSSFYSENIPKNLVLQIGSNASVDDRRISNPMAEKLLEHLNLGAPIAPDIFPADEVHPEAISALLLRKDTFVQIYVFLYHLLTD